MVTVLQTDRLLLRRFETGDSTADARSSRRSAQGHIPSHLPTGFSRRNAQDPKRARLPWRGIANLTVLPAADIQSPLVREGPRSEEHTSELQSRSDLVCRLLLEKKKIQHCTLSRSI